MAQPAAMTMDMWPDAWAKWREQVVAVIRADFPEVLQDILRRFNGRLALNAEVLQGGHIAVGDRAGVETASRTRSGPS